MRAATIAAIALLAALTAPSFAEEPDFAYGDYQRGRYVAAFREATRRVEQKSDPKSMTLLAELYADGLGVPNDDKKAAEWYRLAAARGDREAMFALAMFKMTGRGGPADRPERSDCSKRRSSSAKSSRPTTWRCSISKASRCRGMSNRAAELMTMAAKAGHPEAQYALATFYKEGRGVPKDLEEAARLLGIGARGQHRSAGRIRHRAVQRDRRRQERSRRGRILHQGGQKRQRPGTEQARHDVRRRPRHQSRSGRGRPLAPDRPGRRRQRPRTSTSS